MAQFNLLPDETDTDKDFVKEPEVDPETDTVKLNKLREQTSNENDQSEKENHQKYHLETPMMKRKPLAPLSTISKSTTRLGRIGLGPPKRISPKSDEESLQQTPAFQEYNVDQIFDHSPLVTPYNNNVQPRPIDRSISEESLPQTESLYTDDKAEVEKIRKIAVNGIPYRLLSLIGQGGSSKVYKILSSKGEMLALKKVKLHGLDPATLGGYTNEISLLKRLKNHPFIIDLVDFELNKDRGVLLMILEYGEIDLSQMLIKRKQEGLSDENFIRYFWQEMLKIVNCIHEERIIHCDLKPANFLLVNGNLKLIDFGISKTLSSNTTSVIREEQVGTINYMSPEALSENSQGGLNESGKNKIGRSSDVWSLGCILYEMTFGRPPFAHIKPLLLRLQRIMDPEYDIQYPEGVSDSLVDALKKCFIRNPKERFSIPQLLSHSFVTPLTRSTNEVTLSHNKLKYLIESVMKLKHDRSNEVDQNALVQLILEKFLVRITK